MPFCGQTETQMNSYKRWNNIVGWIVFAIAAMTYLLTMEPSSSLWDCSEFIATSYKLEVGHPPGAPLFMLLARLATILAPSTYYVPHMVNAMNCLASAFCILFLFWTITHLARRILTRQGAELTKANIVAVLGTGAVGALAYTFTDTFWFSAVEGEVYALSSMFTALVVWLMLKWEEQADQPHSMRWIVLIAYLMGLSIGVHILNLLTIPALVFIYYFRKTQRITFKGIAVSTLISGAILIFINSIIIPHTVYIGALFDLFFVNSLGLPVNSGLVFFVVALLGALGMGVYFTHKKGRTVLNLVLLSTLMILIGYSSYASVTIRAAANPPMNSNNPSNPFALYSLLNRDQYGDKPLLYGPQFSAPTSGYKYKDVRYLDDDGKYKTVSIISGYDHADDRSGYGSHEALASGGPDDQVAHGEYAQADPDAEGVERTRINIVAFARFVGRGVEVNHQRDAHHHEEPHDDREVARIAVELIDQADKSQDEGEEIVGVAPLVIRYFVRQVVLRSEVKLVDPLDAREPVAVGDDRVGRLDIALASHEIPEEIAPVHVVELVGEEIVEVLAERRLHDYQRFVARTVVPKRPASEIEHFDLVRASLRVADDFAVFIPFVIGPGAVGAP